LLPDAPRGSLRVSGEDIKMIKQILIPALLPVALGAGAACVTDPPEMGDIGPSSELVCNGLERRFPGAALVIEGRSIHSPTAVSVSASVDGRPTLLRYTLAALTWSITEPGGGTAGLATVRPDPSMGHVAVTHPGQSSMSAR
jgi:hypothetical protein